MPRSSTFVATLALFVVAAVAHADTTVYATGFEPPAFSTGALAGQNGWNVYGPGSTVVQNSSVYSGTQAVSVSGSSTSQSGPFHEDDTTGPIVSLSAEIYIASASSPSEWQFGGLGPGLLGYLGGIDILTNGSIDAITSGFPMIGTFVDNQWNDVDLIFNIESQTYSIALNGTTLDSNIAFCGDNGPCSGAPLTTFGSGLFDTSGNGNDYAFMDNYSVVASTPEPSSLMLFGTSVLGCVGLLRRRLRA